MVYEKLKTAENLQPSALQLEKALERREKAIRPNINDGWAARYFKHTCGREPTHTHSSCIMENGDRYLEPVTANLILNADGISADTCEWRIDDTVLEENSCKRAVVHNIKYNASHDITLKPSTGAPLSATIALKDILIVSFGNSFSSGEGNPEKPVSLVQDTFNPYANSSGGQAFPVREDLNIVEDNSGLFFSRLGSRVDQHAMSPLTILSTC